MDIGEVLSGSGGSDGIGGSGVLARNTEVARRSGVLDFRRAVPEARRLVDARDDDAAGGANTDKEGRDGSCVNVGRGGSGAAKRGALWMGGVLLGGEAGGGTAGGADTSTVGLVAGASLRAANLFCRLRTFRVRFSILALSFFFSLRSLRRAIRICSMK